MNQCGTMALLHSLANTPNLPFRDGPIKTLFEECKGLPMDEAAEKLDIVDISAAHTAAALSGQSEARLSVPTPPDDVHPDGGFSAFVSQNGQLVELDGWNDAPLLHGPIQRDLIHSVLEVVKEIAESKQDIRFTVLALAPATQ
ncbi:cysteine proteinase [Exidia glandulosa HHB12029]|uniref:ubiquitinyl hydrolase 1 n=1 Tax=Exidia glandulosa HHB12029 TaxID=1314781 RepID=A0A165IQI2_EXIGL|nr:cysteine proteinase [Exidia glandulosa HHB12029]